MKLADLRRFYRAALLDDVMPFWMRHALEPGGGINTCIRDDGRLVSRDRYGWSQWRAVWVFSKLYNRIEHRVEWRRAAEDIVRFLADHGPLADGHWPLLLDGDGRLLRGYESIYTDGFAILGLTELWRATGDGAVLGAARATFTAAEHGLRHDDPLPAWPYPVPSGRLAHGISMLFSLACHELAEATCDPAVRAAADRHHRRVMDGFLRPGRGLVLEWLAKDGREIDPPEGTLVSPGHAVESMWIQIHLARSADEQAEIGRAVQAIRRHLEIGWDAEYGGLFWAVDAAGRPDVAWPHHDAKLWWPHTEALYATLLAYECAREPWCLEWHERIREYSFAHYPVATHGEWRQKLDRLGRPLREPVALPVKDPFHLPRALIYCLDVLDRLCGK